MIFSFSNGSTRPTHAPSVVTLYRTRRRRRPPLHRPDVLAVLYFGELVGPLRRPLGTVTHMDPQLDLLGLETRLHMTAFPMPSLATTDEIYGVLTFQVFCPGTQLWEKPRYNQTSKPMHFHI